MLKILNLIQFVLCVFATVFVIIGGKYRLRVKDGDKNNDLYYRNFRLYAWIGLSLLFVSMILSAILFYQQLQ